MVFPSIDDGPDLVKRAGPAGGDPAGGCYRRSVVGGAVTGPVIGYRRLSCLAVASFFRSR